MAETFHDSKRNRHILRGYQYLLWMVVDGRVVMVWIPVHIQMADPTTKDLIGAAEMLVLFCRMFEVIVIL
jgi:hypothetical protein